MLHRSLNLPLNRSCLLLGPRQTGKSTYMRAALPPDAWSVDLLHTRDTLRYLRDPGLFHAEAQAHIERGTGTIFIDEVQKVPGLLDEVHALMERFGTRFLLTGSSARKLVRGGANMLAGRAAIRHLHPLTFQEIGPQFDLGRALLYGTLPPVVTAADEAATDILRSYGDTYLREEIQAEAVVRNLGGFARFLDIAAAQSGDILNYSAVGRDAGLATRTVQEYFQILEDTLLGFRLDAWRNSPRARLLGHPRFYLFDTGVTNALARRLTAGEDRAALGRMFEQWVVLETLRWIDYHQDEARMFYWRTNGGAEVDILIEKHGSLRAAIEVKHRPNVGSADTSGLRSFAEAHPGVPRAVVCTAPEELKIGETLVLPYARYFERLGEWLA